MAGITKHQRYPIEKERNIPYPTQLAKSLQLGIERFCRCVGSARNEVIEYFVLARLYGVPDRLYFSQCGFRNLVIPFVESCPGRVFCKTLVLEYEPKKQSPKRGSEKPLRGKSRIFYLKRTPKKAKNSKIEHLV